MENQTYEGKIFTFSALPGKFGPAIKQELPEMKYVTRTDWGSKLLFSLGDKSIYETGLFADPDFLKMFSFKLLKGDAANLLTDPSSIIITEKMAEKFFGKEGALGKTIKVNNDKPFTITGIIKDVGSLSWLLISPSINLKENIFKKSGSVNIPSS